jgi:hypothetical protein
VDYTLNSLRRNSLAGDRLYDLKTGQPYNPASGVFEGRNSPLPRRIARFTT